MTILKHASDEAIKRLLELYPVSQLRHNWPNIKGTKADICSSVATARDYAAIAKFTHDTLSCCKQHVTVFSRTGKANGLPATLGKGEKVLDVAGATGLYVIPVQYSILLKDPLEEVTLDFLWPARIEARPDYLILRFVVLEKNVSAYFERPAVLSSKDADEQDVIEKLMVAETLEAADLHEGVKAVWKTGFMDSQRVQYKKPHSTASEIMDEAQGIRENNPELYQLLQECPLFNTLFHVKEGNGCMVSAFSVNPSEGKIKFGRYCEKKGDTDYVISKILESNN